MTISKKLDSLSEARGSGPEFKDYTKKYNKARANVDKKLKEINKKLDSDAALFKNNTDMTQFVDAMEEIYRKLSAVSAFISK